MTQRARPLSDVRGAGIVTNADGHHKFAEYTQRTGIYIPTSDKN